MGKRDDTLWGIDRYEHSAMFGELAVPVIYLWKRPGAAVKAENLTGALRHGHFVDVLEKKQHQKSLYCKVRGVERDVVQEGWTRATLLKDAGAAEFAPKGTDSEQDNNIED